MFARQYRETSRAQASCPCFCCWAEAADVIKTKGMTKRILLICYAFVLGNRNQDASITLSSEVGTGSRQENVPKRETRHRNPAENACVASTQAFPRANKEEPIIARRACPSAPRDRGPSPCGSPSSDRRGA